MVRPVRFSLVRHDHAHTLVLVRPRHSYVAAAAQVGRHNAKRESYGHACIIDPWVRPPQLPCRPPDVRPIPQPAPLRSQGEVVASCGEKELGIAVAEVDLAYMDQIRTNMPVFTHRRSDVYGAILPGQPATASEVEVLATTRRA